MATAVLRDHADLFGARRLVVLDDDSFRTQIGEIEFLLCHRPPSDVWQLAGKLRLIQCVGVGTDDLLPAPGLPSDVVICNASGLSSEAMGEFAVAQLLALLKRFPESLRFQQRATWAKVTPRMLRQRTVAVLGAGPVGRYAARLLQAHGATVLGVTRRPRGLPHFDEVHGIEDLLGTLARSHDIIVALPAHPATEQIVGSAALASLRPGGHVVNVARGSLVDTRALQVALHRGHLAGAALDAFLTEPLPADDPLWKDERILVTAHVSWTSCDYVERLAALTAANIAAIEMGGSVRHEVDRAWGYHVL